MDPLDARMWAIELRHVFSRAIKLHHQRDEITPASCARRRTLIEDGRKHLLARAPFDPGRPVVILQGALDAPRQRPARQETLPRGVFVRAFGGHVRHHRALRVIAAVRADGSGETVCAEYEADVAARATQAAGTL